MTESGDECFSTISLDLPSSIKQSMCTLRAVIAVTAVRGWLNVRRVSGVRASAFLVASVVGIASELPSVSTPFTLTSTTVLIMGGTGHPLSTPPDPISYVQQYTSIAIDSYVSPSAGTTRPTGIPKGPYNSVAVITPEQAAPSYGNLPIGQSIAQGLVALNSCITSITCDYNEDVGSAWPTPSDTFVVFGYSQSAAIAMLEKADLFAEYSGGGGPEVSFVVIGGRGRQTANAAGPYDPADSQYATVNIALQYDGFADPPLNSWNVLAGINAHMGISLRHATYGDHSLLEPGVIDQGQFEDTSYYLIPAPVLPLLMPLAQLPILGPILAQTLDPPLRVLIEAGYDRTQSPVQPAEFRLFPASPIKLGVDLFVAIPTGWDNGLEDVFGDRPFGTQRPGPYGVGGPPVTYLNTDATAAAVRGTPPAVSGSTAIEVVGIREGSNMLSTGGPTRGSVTASPRLKKRAFGSPSTSESAQQIRRGGNHIAGAASASPSEQSRRTPTMPARDAGQSSLRVVASSSS